MKRSNTLSKEERKKRQDILIAEMQRLSKEVEGKTLTQYEFSRRAILPFPVNSFMTIFGSYGEFKKQAGIHDRVDPTLRYMIKAIELKKVAKSVALENGNKLSYDILAKALDKSPSNIRQIVCVYCGGLQRLCKAIKCIPVINAGRPTKELGSEKPIDSQKEQLEVFIKQLAKQHEGCISRELVLKSSGQLNLKPNSMDSRIHTVYGSYELMCKQLNARWVPHTKGIDYKELDILRDMRRIYLRHNRTFSKSMYKREGKYSLTLIEEYFGSFGKACNEINIKTKSMAEELAV